MSQIHPFDRPGVRAVISQRLKVSQQVLTNWKKRGVPVEFCNRICVATKGAVTRQELRPNDFWLIWPDLKAPKKAA